MKWIVMVGVLLGVLGLGLPVAWAQGCPNPLPSDGLVPKNDASPEFNVGADGGVERNEYVVHANLGTVGFFEGPDDSAKPWDFVYVRIWGLSSARPVPKLMYCGQVHRSRRLKLDRDHLNDGADVWQIEVFWNGPAAAAVESNESSYIYEKYVARLERAGADDLAARVDLSDARGVKKLADMVQSQSIQEESPGPKKDIDYAKAAETATAAYPAAKAGVSSLLADADVTALRNLAQRLETSPTVPDLQTFTASWKAFVAKHQGKFVADVPYDANYSAPHCAATVGWLEQVKLGWEHGWKFGVFQLPSTPADHTFALVIGSPAPTPSAKIHVYTPLEVTAWVTRVPVKSEVRLVWQIGNSTAPDVASTIAALVQAVTTALPKATGLDAYKMAAYLGLPTPTEPSPQEQIEDLLKGLTSEKPCTSASKKILTLGPAAYTSFARTTAMTMQQALVREHEYTVTATVRGSNAADGSSPEPAGPTKQENADQKVQAQFTSPRGLDWALLGTIAYDFNLRPEYNGAVGGQFTAYQWRPTTSVGASQTVFELDQVPQPLQSFSLSLLIGVLLPEETFGRLGFAAGPTLLWGSGSNGALLQWDALDIVYSPPFNGWRNLYITYGVIGFRGVDQPLVERQGYTVAVNGTNGAAAVAPSLATRRAWTSVMSLGIGFDLSTIPDYAKSLFGTTAPSASGAAPAKTPPPN